MKIYKIIPSGLGNRLLYILEVLRSNNNNEHITIIWNNNEHCDGFYNDFFLPINNITITQNEQFDNIIPSNKHYINHTSEDYDRPEYYNIFHNIKINIDIENIVDNYVKNIGKFISIHIRRGDFKRLTQSLKNKGWDTDDLSEDKYFDFINKFPEHNIFLATDCPKIRKLFINKYGERLKYHSSIFAGLRRTTIKDALIDMYICSKTPYFLGTRLSTYSVFIELLIKHN